MMLFDGYGKKTKRVALKYFSDALHTNPPSRDFAASNPEIITRIDQAALTSITAQFMHAIIYDLTPGNRANAQRMYDKAILWDPAPVFDHEIEASFYAIRRLARNYISADVGFPNDPERAIRLLELGKRRGDAISSQMLQDYNAIMLQQGPLHV